MTGAELLALVLVKTLVLILFTRQRKPRVRSVSVTRLQVRRGRIDWNCYQLLIRDGRRVLSLPLPMNLFTQPGTPALIGMLRECHSVTLSTEFESGDKYKLRIPDWATGLVAVELQRLMPGMR